MEIARLSIIHFDGARMFFPELRIANDDLGNWLPQSAVVRDRNGQPLKSCGGLDAVSVVPGLLHKLCVIEKYKLIDLVDQVEKSTPWQVSGLRDRDFHSFASSKLSSIFNLDLARPGIASATIAPHPAIMDQNLANPHRAMSINKFSTQHGEAHPPLGRICQLD